MTLKNEVKAVVEGLNEKERAILEARFGVKHIDDIVGKKKETNQMKIRPILDLVFVRRCEAEEVTPGGIIIPEKAKEKPVEGIAVAVGPGRYTSTGVLLPMNVKEGDKVLLPKWTDEIEVDEEKLVVVAEDQILAVYE